MLLERFEEKGLSHYSYAVGCKEKGQIAIIDPRFDVDIYLEYAEKNQLVISHVFETHIHADYASGARYLATRAEATLGISAYDKGEKYEVDFPHKECFDGDAFQLGSLIIKILYTPGHTPEHISFLALEGNKPRALFSGDFLFVGSVGRPDLIGKDRTMGLAKQQYHSTKEKLESLPSTLKIYPSHGSGSFCGGGIASRPFSTLGQERLTNPFLKPDINEEEFIDLILLRIPLIPDYFVLMKDYNSCSKRCQLVSAVPLELSDFKNKFEKGAAIIDLRNQHVFSRCHIPGSICIGGGEKVVFWASTSVSYDVPILIVTNDPMIVPDAFVSLARVGLTSAEGYLKGGIDIWEESGEKIEKVARISPQTLNDAEERVHVIDVRSFGEWVRGHIKNSCHIPCSELSKRVGELPEGQIVFVCAGGYRSILAASIALKHGRKLVAHLPGGVMAWRGAGLPLTV